MKNPPLLNFDEGLEQIVERFRNCNCKPFIAHILGMPGSGKSKFRSEIVQKLDKNNIYGWSGMIGEDISSVQYFITKSPSFILLEDVGYAPGQIIYTLNNFGKIVDFRVLLIRNLKDQRLGFNNSDIEKGYYDLIIKNKKSKGQGRFSQ